MLDRLTARVLEEWPRLFPGAPRPARIDYTIASGSLEGGTVTFLGFADHAARPAFVAKTSRDPQDSFQIEQEAAILEDLHARGEFFRRSVPGALLCEKLDAGSYLVESVVDGRQMTVVADAGGLPAGTDTEANLRLALDWLVECHRATWTAGEVRWQEVARRAVDDFETTFEPTGHEREALEEVRRWIAAADGVASGQCVRHGDFCRHNVLVGAGPRIAVIDWTSGRLLGLPVHDLVFFVTTYAMQARTRGGSEALERAFVRTFLEENRYSALVQALLADYCDRLGIPSAARSVLFAVGLLEQAVLDYRSTVKALQRGILPRTTVMLAAAAAVAYEDAARAQLWRGFFRLFAARRR